MTLSGALIIARGRNVNTRALRIHPSTVSQIRCRPFFPADCMVDYPGFCADRVEIDEIVLKVYKTLSKLLKKTFIRMDFNLHAFEKYKIHATHVCID